MKFETAKNHPKEELQAAAQWYANAVGSGQLESWKRAGLALDEFGRVEPQIINPYWPTCNHWGLQIPQKGLVILQCPRCKQCVTRLTLQPDREFFRSIENDRTREEEPYDVALWNELLIAALPFRKGPVPDIPFVLPQGAAVSKKRTKRLSETKEEIYLAFDPTDHATQKGIWLAVMQARWRSWWRGLPARMFKRAALMATRDGGLQREAFIFELRNNGYMLADGRRWKRIKKPIRKIAAGLPTEIAQLRISGLTYGEIAKRLGKLESEIRLLVRKLSIKARSASNSRRIDSSISKSDMLVTSEEK
jgi:hypothetical protein